MKAKYILTLFLVCLISSCSEEFLEKDPLVVTSVETYYSNEEEAYTAIVGAYSVLQSEGFQVPHLLLMGDGCSDNTDISNSESDAYSWLGYVIIPLQKFEGTSGNWLLLWPWATAWQGISYATRAIENIEGNENIPEEAREQFVGEAHFLRALWYFLMTRGYGGLPIVDHVLEYDEYFSPRASIEETWAFIESDLMAASQRLPEKSELTGIDVGRATKGAADALLGEVYMYQGKFQEAYDILKTVITSGEYTLEPTYSDIFSIEHENGVESIFEIQHSTSGTGWGNANEGTMLGYYEHDADPSDPVRGHHGWGMHNPTQDLVDAFETGDPRLNATVIFQGEEFDGRIHNNVISSTGYMPKKWYVPLDLRNPADASDNPKNVILLRYAGILLYMAEAANELGYTAEALGYLEQVRGRARSNSTDPNVLPEITETDKELLRELIWHERRVEMACEGDRFYQLVRQGRAGEVMRAYSQKYNSYKGQSFVDGVNEIFPIPQSEIDASKGALVQNPGY